VFFLRGSTEAIEIR